MEYSTEAARRIKGISRSTTRTSVGGRWIARPNSCHSTRHTRQYFHHNHTHQQVHLAHFWIPDYLPVETRPNASNLGGPPDFSSFKTRCFHREQETCFTKYRSSNTRLSIFIVSLHIIPITKKLQLSSPNVLIIATKRNCSIAISMSLERFAVVGTPPTAAGRNIVE